MADQITEVQRVKQATMNGYFYVLTAIDLFVLSFMCILTKLSESLNKKQKQGFFFAFALIAVISVLEVVTLAVDGTPAGYRWLNILSNRPVPGSVSLPCVCHGPEKEDEPLVQGGGVLRGVLPAVPCSVHPRRAGVLRQRRQRLFSRAILLYLYHHVLCGHRVSFGVHHCHGAGISESQPGADLPPDDLSAH